MLPVLTTDEMRALDRATMDAGLGGFTLMETAGRGVATKVLELLEEAPPPARNPFAPVVTLTKSEVLSGEIPPPAVPSQRAMPSVVIVCGPGNNGGDGFVVGRVLRDRGVDVFVLLAVPRDKVTGHALQHLELFEKFGGRVQVFGESPASLRASVPEAVMRLQSATIHLERITCASVVVDALFGIGTTRPIEGDLAIIVEAINRVPMRVAVDVPSGINTDTGEVPRTSANREGAVVHATHTVTVAAHKVGIVGSPGFAHAGEVTVVDIGIPASFLPRGGKIDAHEVRASAWLLEESDVRGWLPIPQPLDHKGTRGHLLVISGAPEMRGAGRLAASAGLASETHDDGNATHAAGSHDVGGANPETSAVSALRGGAGLVTLAGDGDVAASEAAVMTKSIGDDGLAPLVDKKTAVVIGPGLGTSDAALARVHEVLKTGKPCVLDADALNLLAREGAEGIGKAGPVVITPHPAEAARLLGCTTPEIEADRMKAARDLAKKTHAIVVLKGARTVICDGTEGNRSAKVMRCFINPTGASSLATGGTGDVLAGLIGGLLAQGVFGVRAACCGAFLHGRAGELLYARYGRGALSSDLPRVIAELLGAMTPHAGRS